MRAGIVVRVAGNGQEALDVLARERFDAVLMDCQMPVMDGFTATRALRQQPGLQALPVIAMTANAMAGDREAVLAAGMNDHIAKPIVVDAMFDTLARWVTPTHSAGAGGRGRTCASLVSGQRHRFPLRRGQHGRQRRVVPTDARHVPRARDELCAAFPCRTRCR